MTGKTTLLSEVRPSDLFVVTGPIGTTDSQFQRGMEASNLPGQPTLKFEMFGSKAVVNGRPMFRQARMITAELEVQLRVTGRNHVVVHIGGRSTDMTRGALPCPLDERLVVDEAQLA